MLWEEIEEVNVCRKTEGGDECSTYAFPTCCFPTKFISHLEIGSGNIALYVIRAGVC